RARCSPACCWPTRSTGPRPAQDPGGAAGGDGRGSGQHRRGHPPPAESVRGAGHRQPDRVRGHLPAARGPARPVHRPGQPRLPGRRRRGRDGPPPAGPRVRGPGAAAGRRRGPAAGHAGVAGAGAAAPGPARLRGRPGRRDPDPSAGYGGRVAARHAGGDPAGPRARRAGRPGGRDPGGHQGGGRARAGAPPGAAPGHVGQASDRRGRGRPDPGRGPRAEKQHPVKKPFSGRTDSAASPGPPPAVGPGPGRWSASARSRSLATATLLALVAAVLTGHVALVLLAEPVLGALALMPRRRPAAELAVDVTLSGSRCFEGEDVTITATVRGGPLEEVMIRLEPAPRVTLADPAQGVRTFLGDGGAAGPTARWVLRPGRWGRYSPGAVLVSGRAGLGGFQTSVRVELDPLEIFPRAARMRSRQVPAELLRRIGEHTGRAVGEGVEFAGLRPYVPGGQLRDVNRAVSIRRGQLHVNQRAAARAADLVVMIDSLGGPGPVADRTLDAAARCAGSGRPTGCGSSTASPSRCCAPATTVSSPRTSAGSRGPRCRRARWWWCSRRCSTHAPSVPSPTCGSAGSR